MFKMGPKWVPIKTGQISIAHAYFQLPPDPKRHIKTKTTAIWHPFGLRQPAAALDGPSGPRSLDGDETVPMRPFNVSNPVLFETRGEETNVHQNSHSKLHRTLRRNDVARAQHHRLGPRHRARPRGVRGDFRDRRRRRI